MPWNLIAGGIQSGVSAAAASRNRGWARKNMRNQIRWRMEDMRAGGLNPILAAGGGTGGGVASAAAMVTPDMSKAVSEGTQRRNETKVAKAQSHLMEAQTAKTYAEYANTLKQSQLLEYGMPRARLMEQVDKRALQPFINAIEPYLPGGNTGKTSQKGK